MYTLVCVGDAWSYVKAHRKTDYNINIASFKPIEHRLWVKYDLP
jgi:hypothetical protein